MHRANPSWKRFCGVACVALVAGGSLRAADPVTATTAAAIVATRPGEAESASRAAIRKGVAYLLAQQKNGTWERQPERNGITHTGGETALVLYTLLQLGECLDDASLRPESEAISTVTRWLIKQEPKTTYVAAMQALVLSKLPLGGEDDTRKAAERARAYLASAMRPDGGFTYTAETKDRVAPDNANGCFAIQALAALQQAGVESPPALWNVANDYWHLKQHKDGGWGYDDQTRKLATAGMTAAGVASLQLTAAFRENKTVEGEVPRDMALTNGLTFLASECKPDSRDYFFLYQLQRAAGGAGLRTLAKCEICKDTAEALAKSQNADGSWQAEFADPSITGDQRLVSTCYAMLVLSTGFQPVVLSKLEYAGTDGRWDARPRDAANLTLWLSSKFSRPMRWQIIGPNTPPADDAAAPILLITGAKDPHLTDAMLARIGRFVEAGGVVLSVAEGPEPSEFTTAILQTYAPKSLGKKYGFRELPANHPLFDMWNRTTPMKTLGLSNGVRELWVHIPADLGASWQARRLDEKDHFMLPVNLYSYITGKGETWNIDLPPAPTGTQAATAEVVRRISVARVIYSGNGDPEPGAWARLARRAPTLFHTQVNLEFLPPGKLDVAKFPLAHLTGTGKLTLSDAEIAGLKSYVDAGGTLVIEAAGGDADFAKSALAILTKLAPDAVLATIPANDQLYNGAMPDSVRLVDVEYRRFSLTARRKEVAPRLQGIARGGRWAVIYSEDDFTSGLLGTSTWGISGYAPRDAEAIARDLLLYSLKPIVTPTTVAAQTRP